MKIASIRTSRLIGVIRTVYYIVGTKLWVRDFGFTWHSFSYAICASL